VPGRNPNRPVQLIGGRVCCIVRTFGPPTFNAYAALFCVEELKCSVVPHSMPVLQAGRYSVK